MVNVLGLSQKSLDFKTKDNKIGISRWNLYLWRHYMHEYKKDKFNSLNLRYWFMKDNIDIDFWKVVADIWVLKYWYLSLLKESIDTKNRISLDYITVSESNKRTLVSFLKKKGFIGNYKLKWDSKKVLYLNPFYAHRGKTISKELFDAFDSTNWGKVY